MVWAVRIEADREDFERRILALLRRIDDPRPRAGECRVHASVQALPPSCPESSPDHVPRYARAQHLRSADHVGLVLQRLVPAGFGVVMHGSAASAIHPGIRASLPRPVNNLPGSLLPGENAQVLSHPRAITPRSAARGHRVSVIM